MAYMEQLERVRRKLKKLEKLSAVAETETISIPTDDHVEYVDTLYDYFQNCWHLKDWVRNDIAAPATLKAAVQRMESERDWVNSLMLSADIANGSKHFNLNRFARLDAKAKGQIMVRIAEGFNNEKSTTSVQFRYQIVEASGANYDALDVARQALADWENLITTNGGTV